MERIVGDLNSRGSNLYTDPSVRMKERPGTRGKAFEDYGSSLGSQPWNSSPDRSQNTRKCVDKGKKLTGIYTHTTLNDDNIDFDSGDELDILSSPHRGASGPLTTKIKDPAVLFPPLPKGLNFTKTVGNNNETTSGPSSSLSKPPTFNENRPSPAKRSADNDITIHDIRKPAPRTTYGSRSCAGNNPPSSSSRVLHEKIPNQHRTVTTQPKSKRPLDEIGSDPKKPSRSQTRPLGARSSSSQLNLQPLDNLSNDSTSGAKPGATRNRKNGPRKPMPFPIGEVSPVGSEQKKTPKEGKKSIELGDSSPPSSRKSTSFPAPSPLAKTPVRAKKTRTNRVGAFPAISPLSSQCADSNLKAKSKAKRSEHMCKGLAPFPMSSSVLESIRSSPTTPQARLSRLRKRQSSEENREQGGKEKMREDDVASGSWDDYNFEEDDSMFISPSTDPRTLCPYCDSPLPPFPTPLLTRLMTTTAKKSYRDPRPANPLGRKAPLAVFIGVCQRHRFESETLPEAEKKGWPKVIEWEKLGGRVQKMEKALRALIDDRGDEFENSWDGDDNGPRSKCVFWKEVIKEIREKGSRAVAGVRGQFDNFEKAQPGYYGELGSVIIHQTLYNLFPPTSFDPKLIAPLTFNEFIQRILVPEVGARLVMEDRGLFGKSGMEAAVKVLRESASYGVAMFAEDGGEWDAGRDARGHEREGEDVGMGVGDTIVMERARKRRKELEEEEKELEEEEEEKQDKELRAAERIEKGGSESEENVEEKKVKGGQKRKGKADSMEDSDSELEQLRPKRRRERLSKTKNGGIMQSSDSDAGNGPSGRKGGKRDDSDVDAVSEMHAAHIKPRSRQTSRCRSASIFEFETKQIDETKHTRKARGEVSGGETDVSLDVHSSSDAAKRSVGAKENLPRRKGRALTSRKLCKAGEVTDHDDSGIEMVHSPRGTAASPDRNSEKHEDRTPRAALKKRTGSQEFSGLSCAARTSTSTLPPLLAARLRTQHRVQERRPGDKELWVMSMTTPLEVSDDGESFTTPTKSDSLFPRTRRSAQRSADQDAWLLSDNSPCSIELELGYP